MGQAEDIVAASCGTVQDNKAGFDQAARAFGGSRWS